AWSAGAVEPEARRTAGDVGKQICFLLGRPYLQLRSRLGPDVDAQAPAPAARHFHAADVTAVSAVQSVGDAQDSRQLPHHAALLGSEQLQLFVPVLRNRPPAIAGYPGAQPA